MTLRPMTEVSTSNLGYIHVILENVLLDKCSVWLFSHAKNVYKKKHKLKRENESVCRPICRYFNFYFISLQVFNYHEILVYYYQPSISK